MLYTSLRVYYTSDIGLQSLQFQYRTVIPVEYDVALTFILVKHMTKENVYDYQCLDISDIDTCYHLLLEGEFYWITT